MLTVKSNLNELLSDCGTIDATSWQPPANMSYEVWEDVGQRFQHVSGSINWWLGDWINEGEKRYGETYVQAIELTGNRLEQLKNCAWVSNAVKKSTRVDFLTWTHHRHIAHLPEAEQIIWLNHAAEHELSSRDLKQALELANAQKKPLPKPELNWVEGTPQEAPLPEQYQVDDESTIDEEPPFADKNGVLYEQSDDYSAESDAYSGSADGYDWTEEDDSQPELPEPPAADSMGVHYSSDKHDWETPQELFDVLNQEFKFSLDVCALKGTAKCEDYFTPVDDGLSQNWYNDVCWMNPPYGDAIKDWIRKAYLESNRGATVVCLVPARVDTAWWWDNCIHGQIRFLKGRLKFKQNGMEESSAPFPSAVIVFSEDIAPETLWWDWKADV